WHSPQPGGGDEVFANSGACCPPYFNSSAQATTFAYTVGNFPAGDLMVIRVGDGTGLSSGVSAPVFVDEYTTAGALVGSIAIPSSGTAPLTMSGTATSEGALTRSSDLRFLCFTGFKANSA